jgi:hypothetical protein
VIGHAGGDIACFGCMNKKGRCSRRQEGPAYRTLCPVYSGVLSQVGVGRRAPVLEHRAGDRQGNWQDREDCRMTSARKATRKHSPGLFRGDAPPLSAPHSPPRFCQKDPRRLTPPCGLRHLGRSYRSSIFKVLLLCYAESNLTESD